MTLETNDTAVRRNRNRSWWEQRTKMERNAVILLVIAAILILILIIALAIVAHKSKGIDNEICTTSTCVKSASTFINGIDESMDPCDNFYKFACGGFLKETIIPDDKTDVSHFTEIMDDLQIQLKELVQKPAEPGELRPFVLLKDYYANCMDTNQIEKDGFAPIQDLLKKLGGWPMVEGQNWNEYDFDWQQSIYKYRKYGLSTDNFMKISVEPDLKNSTRVIVSLDQADLEIARSNLILGMEDEVVQEYYKYMIDIALIFGAHRRYAELDMRSMIDFRVQLANISLSEEERRDRTEMYHLMSVKELQQKYPSIYWLEFLNNVIVLPEKRITNDDYVNVNVPTYFSAIGDLLQRTPKRAQANHAIAQTLRSLEMYLPEAVRKREQEFLATITGVKDRLPRYKECINKISKLFQIAISAMYVRTYFDEESKHVAKQMVTDIQNEFVNILKKTDWMDEATRKLAIEKALSIKPHVGYADELLDDKKLEEHYAELTIDSGNCLQSAQNASVFDKDLEFKLLGVPLNNSDWRTRLPPTDINAVYAGHENSIQIPAVIFQNIFFNKDRLKALNYGGIGSFIGHEITHGFDDQGKKLNKEGNLEQWWAKETHDAFLNKAKCIIDQYSKYNATEVGILINGVNTQGENIADNGGFKEAYLAYEAWTKRNGQEKKLPGLKYSPKQLFWISLASCWCTKTRPETLETELIGDVHSPPEFRVIGALSNLEYFSKDFNCPLGSRMNPKDKCKVW